VTLLGSGGGDGGSGGSGEGTTPTITTPVTGGGYGLLLTNTGAGVATVEGFEIMVRQSSTGTAR
jgi:hypothetical protein